MATAEIDDSLYSRQRYVLGDNAMQRMAKSNILMCGLGGLGAEIAKNIILAGVKSVTLQDSQTSSFLDLGSQFYLTEEDVKNGRNRAEASASKLAELNPYVAVKTRVEPLTADTNLSFLADFQCVVVTEASLDLQKKVNEFCRSQEPQIKFVSADVYGVFCWCFCDFGDSFEVIDTNGEEPKEVFIGQITKGNPGEVTTLDNKMHGLESGDNVTFREVKGMPQLNDKEFQVQVMSPYAFSICDTSGSEFGNYERSGTVRQVKKPVAQKFESLEKQLLNPSFQVADLSKFEAPLNIHLGMLALHQFRQEHCRLPNVRCENDAALLLQIANSINNSLESKVENIDTSLLKNLSFTSQGCFAPLCAFLGGLVAQEALKAVTGKFTPLNQWFHLDACEVLSGVESEQLQSFQPLQNRYDALRICLGQQICNQLSNLKLFMVGCGAIGCEMLKNYALLGIGCKPHGKLTITDHDLIEKSNLNRQFLFRPQHIQKPKSSTAAESAKDINSDLCIDPHQKKVCPITEKTLYTDDFFVNQDLIVNALDNIEARRYVDSRCVTNQRALLESGTLGAKGHVQVVVPHLTESYSSQRDPVDDDIPYCTLKSFPAIIEHCIQWARDKFESSFVQKPQHFSKFWSFNTSPEGVIQELKTGGNLDGVIQVSKMASNRPNSWEECVRLARLKFEKYFNHKAKQLLHAFPLDTRMKDGDLFWQSPKRPPTPQVFDTNSDVHMSFIVSCARLYADISGVRWTPADVTSANICKILSTVQVPEFRASSKEIITDESMKKQEKVETTGDELEDAANRLNCVLDKKDSVFKPMSYLSFEKDDDSNGHIDFITAASNLRAAMYSIEPADRLRTKRIAGRIVPAIATTTAAVAGLASVELIKLIKKATLENYKNAFLNLALPMFLLSEPGPLEKTVMSNGVTYTLWDRWEIQGNKDMTVGQFIQALKEKYGVNASMIVQGVKSIYLPVMPTHKKRLTQPIMKFLKQTPGKNYEDLVVCYAPQDPSADDEMGPSVRYFYK